MAWARPPRSPHGLAGGASFGVPHRTAEGRLRSWLAGLGRHVGARRATRTAIAQHPASRTHLTQGPAAAGPRGPRATYPRRPELSVIPCHFAQNSLLKHLESSTTICSCIGWSRSRSQSRCRRSRLDDAVNVEMCHDPRARRRHASQGVTGNDPVQPSGLLSARLHLPDASGRACAVQVIALDTASLKATTPPRSAAPMRPETFKLPDSTAYFCSCRDSCVVYRMSCSAAMAFCLLAKRRKRLSNPTRRAFYCSKE